MHGWVLPRFPPSVRFDAAGWVLPRFPPSVRFDAALEEALSCSPAQGAGFARQGSLLSKGGRQQPLVTPCVTTHVFSTCTLGSHHGTTPPPWSSARLRPATSPSASCSSASIRPPHRRIRAGAAGSAAQTTNQEPPLACPTVERRTTERSAH
ncbi:uncharacterized protein LOC119311257 [Triticum dicoccoides]|uniref:uncharacterized protein LOC119311257 n=1 Tax=Triticum dicoccoides TaxID=85692 RepID=UPI0018912460|nr:uncharacterized protein LOC119311257 [Triticum dicoccoides]